MLLYIYKMAGQAWKDKILAIKKSWKQAGTSNNNLENFMMSQQNSMLNVCDFWIKSNLKQSSKVM